MTNEMDTLNKLGADTIRVLSAEAIENAGSGHPGTPIGAASIIFELFNNHLNFNPNQPDWVNRDRFVLSAGHASALLYTALHLFGYEVTLEDLTKLRRLGSITPGHPEYRLTPGVECTTGPLGQGVAMGVGMAIAEAHMGALFNTADKTVIDHYTYVFAGDGCLQEGVSSEACSLAGTLKLNKLIILYDSNDITIDGPTSLSFTEDVGKRFEAYNWQVLTVEEGDNQEKIGQAINRAKKSQDRPTIIIVKTIIGLGCPKQGDCSMHGSLLGAEQMEFFKNHYGFDLSRDFQVSDDLRDYLAKVVNRKKIAYDSWHQIYGDLPEETKRVLDKYDNHMTFDLDFNYDDIEQVEKPTRIWSGEILNKISRDIPSLFGGSADLTTPTQSEQKESSYFSPQDRLGRNLHYGVREFAMAAISNGLATQGLRSYAATFLVFSDYMRNAIRLSALMNLPVLYILTHDSIFIGADGPTHQPVEHISSLRLIPNLNVWRPADAIETHEAYKSAMKSIGPTAILLTRQNVQPLSHKNTDYIQKGGYVFEKESDERLDLVIIATGSEVSLAKDVAIELRQMGKFVRVVSIPSVNVFEKQTDEYRKEVLGSENITRIVIEAGADALWYKFVGFDGLVIGQNKFGESGGEDELREEAGFTVSGVIKTILKALGGD